MQQGFEAFERVFVHLADFAQSRRSPFFQTAQALQIEGTARLGACSRQAVAAEGLDADDGADDVAVDVNIAGLDAAADMLDRAVYAAVYAVGERVAFTVNLIDEFVQPVGGIADDVQHRTENFALQFAEAV